MKAAITGTGFMGVVHAEALRRCGIEVVGIHGSSPEKSEKAAKQLSIPKAYASYDDLVGDPDIDAVHITTPNRFHFAMAKQALEAGKHVLCEKPLAMNTTESATLVELASSKQLAAGVNYNIRFYPLCLEARHRVRSGRIGQVYSVFGSYVQDWLLHETDYNWRVLAEEGGELRALADIGTHWLDLVQTITGLKVTSVFADLKTVHEKRLRPESEVETFSGKVTNEEIEMHAVRVTTEDLGVITLRFENDTRGSLFVSQVTAGRKNCLRFEIAGSEGAIGWESERPNELWLGHRDEPNQTVIKDPGLSHPATRPYIDYPAGHAEGFPDSFKMCFRAFYNHIEQGDFTATPDFPTFAEGHQEIVLCEAILQSHREGRWVHL